VALVAPLRLLVGGRQETPEHGEARVDLLLGAGGHLMPSATAPTTFWAGWVTVEHETANQVETLNREATHINRVATANAFSFASGVALFKDLFVEFHLEKCLCWRKTPRTYALLQAVDAPNNTHTTICPISA
jgi:hypothetical protein